MASSAVDVEVRLKMKDSGATAGIKAASQAAEQASSKSATAAVAAANKSISAVNAQHDSHIKAYQEIASARETLGVRSERTIQNAIRQTQSAYEILARSGTASARELARAQDASVGKVRELRKEMGEVSKMQRLGQVAQGGAAVAAGGMVAKAVIDNPVRSYADLEAAQADLKISLMTKGGKVSAAYDEIMKQSTDLGNKLPGATKDFVAAASALKEQGMTESAITGGGLKASAYFGVLADMNQYQSATTIAKMREAYGLGDNELPNMANLMQKARYAYGIHPDDFRAVAAYAAPTYNTMKLTGTQHAKELLAVQGMAAGVGLENTSFGTNFAMMLTRTAQIDSRLGGKGKEAAEARQTLAEHGIKMNFFDKQGKFAGIEHMFAELDKLKPLKDIDRMHVLSKLFGVEAGRPASIMIEKGGLKGFKDSLAKLDNQADMEERITMKTSTLKSKDEALSGTWENTKASAAQGLGDLKKRILDSVNAILGDSIQPTIDKHPGLGTAAISTTAAGAGVGTSVATWLGLKSLAGAEVPVVSKMAGWITQSLAKVLPSSSTASSVARGVGPLAVASGLMYVANESGRKDAERLGIDPSKRREYLEAQQQAVSRAERDAGTQRIIEQALAAGKMTPELAERALKATLTVNLAPGLVLQNQNVQSSGANHFQVNTGNLWNGAPG